mgnify:CR=1 FL=1
MEETSIKKKNTFEFCEKEFKSFKEDILCTQDDLHKSMEGNAVGFILFYVFAVIFVALLFQLSTKDFSKKGKKNK